MEPAREAPAPAIAAFERSSEALGRARAALRTAVFGQDEAVDLALCAVVAGGWALITGAPGSGKTRLATALGRVLGLETGAVAFTPDLDLDELADETETPRSESRFGQRRPRPGPLFRQLLLADALDRASPRVRSALLAAAHEGALAGRALPRPFHLIATAGQDTSLGLDETEIDRFLLQIELYAPDRGGERRMLIETAASDQLTAPRVLEGDALLTAQRTAVELPVGEKVVEAILDLVRRARPDDPSSPAIVREAVARGPGPRAGQALMRLSRARALIDGRLSPSAADVKALAGPVLKPRLTLAESRPRGLDADAVIRALVEGM
jgi:MoxR-like ATPase